MRVSFAWLVVVVAFAAGCKNDNVSGGIARRGVDCSTGATAFIALRKSAGEYGKEELDKRTKATEEDVKWCVAGAPRATCCVAAKRIHDRVGGRGKVAICDDFFTALSDDGCTELK